MTISNTTSKPAARTAAKPAAARAPRATAARTTAARAAAAPAVATTPDFTKRYKMITGIDDSEFCSRVSLHLDNGYELYGSPTSTFNGKNVIVGQAVVLKKLPAKAKGKSKTSKGKKK
ncbi:DUF1737 domain-containing protein [Rhodoluna sp.]|mgnify:FL=1|jgi:hypothetical protein|uniref:DUF1737 domain-containing protein n=1 Tax=Rhodoluna sp. TaxID=1969481 RepID=UPI0025E0907E|nr:DUF1737 domain-containing protein [Rhodoluna sp.]